MRRRMRKANRNQGATLVEMLVCFALLGMLMVSATIVIASAMNVYKQVKAML